MDYKTLCNQTKCSKRNNCLKYKSWLRNMLKIDVRLIPFRAEKQCKDYDPLSNN